LAAADLLSLEFSGSGVHDYGMQSVEDLFLADDLAAAGYGPVAEWEIRASHDDVERERAGPAQGAEGDALSL